MRDEEVEEEGIYKLVGTSYWLGLVRGEECSSTAILALCRGIPAK